MAQYSTTQRRDECNAKQARNLERRPERWQRFGVFIQPGFKQHPVLIYDSLRKYTRHQPGGAHCCRARGVLFNGAICPVRKREPYPFEHRDRGHPYHGQARLRLDDHRCSPRRGGPCPERGFCSLPKSSRKRQEWLPGFESSQSKHHNEREARRVRFDPATVAEDLVSQKINYAP
jgi:hypothetical protein